MFPANSKLWKSNMESPLIIDALLSNRQNP